MVIKDLQNSRFFVQSFFEQSVIGPSWVQEIEFQRLKQEIERFFSQELKSLLHFLEDQKLKERFDLLIMAVFKRSKVKIMLFRLLIS
jgi:hypothetical protein